MSGCPFGRRQLRGLRLVLVGDPVIEAPPHVWQVPVTGRVTVPSVRGLQSVLDMVVGSTSCSVPNLNDRVDIERTICFNTHTIMFIY